MGTKLVGVGHGGAKTVWIGEEEKELITAAIC